MASIHAMRFVFANAHQPDAQARGRDSGRRCDMYVRKARLVSGSSSEAYYGLLPTAAWKRQTYCVPRSRFGLV